MWKQCVRKPTKAVALMNTGDNIGQIIDWFIKSGEGDKVRFNGDTLAVQASTGRHEVPVGWLIVCETKGEFEVMHPDVFAHEFDCKTPRRRHGNKEVQ